MDGKLRKLENGFSSYEIFEADQNHIFIFADILEKQFSFRMINTPMLGLDSVYWEASKGSVKLTVGWDIWSGAFSMANCLSGNGYVEKVATYSNHEKPQQKYWVL